jgi:hypothetical protein
MFSDLFVTVGINSKKRKSTANSTIPFNIPTFRLNSLLQGTYINNYSCIADWRFREFYPCRKFNLAWRVPDESRAKQQRHFSALYE